MENNYLIHHGVKGQKWGVRRFQNKDGSLTKAGKKKRQSYLDKRYSLNDKGRERILQLTRQENNVLEAPELFKRTNSVYNKYLPLRDKTDIEFEKKGREYMKSRWNSEHIYEELTVGRKTDIATAEQKRRAENDLLADEWRIHKNREVRMKASAGKSWFEQYCKDMSDAHDEDIKEMFGRK